MDGEYNRALLSLYSNLYKYKNNQNPHLHTFGPQMATQTMAGPANERHLRRLGPRPAATKRNPGALQWKMI
jgi:hypothetical protein